VYYLGFLKQNTRDVVIFKSTKPPRRNEYSYFVRVMGPYQTEEGARKGLHSLKEAYGEYGYRENPTVESRAQYCRERQLDPSKFAKESFRTITLGKGKKGVIACPKDHYHNGRCSVGTRLQTILHPVGAKGCRVGGTELKKRKRNPISESQIKRGILHELEHTTDREIARKIACDHLKEDSKYYTHLAKMEKQYKKNVMSRAKALKLTKKVFDFAKDVYGTYQENPGQEYHDQKFLRFMNELEKYKVGSAPYIATLAKAYEHLESAKDSMKEGVR